MEFLTLFSIIRGRTNEKTQGEASVANIKGKLGLKCLRTLSRAILFLILVNARSQAVHHINFTLVLATHLRGE